MGRARYFRNRIDLVLTLSGGGVVHTLSSGRVQVFALRHIPVDAAVFVVRSYATRS